MEPLTSLRTTDAVHVAIPARAEFLHVLRSVTGAVAGHLLLTLDDIDDLRLAVDEACERLLSLPGTPRTIRLELRAVPGRGGDSRTHSRGGSSGPGGPTCSSSSRWKPPRSGSRSGRSEGSAEHTRPI